MLATVLQAAGIVLGVTGLIVALGAGGVLMFLGGGLVTAGLLLEGKS